MVQQVKNMSAVQETQETWVRSLGWEVPLEEEMATHSNIFSLLCFYLFIFNRSVIALQYCVHFCHAST